MDSPLATSGVDSIGFFELSPLPNRTEVYIKSSYFPIGVYTCIIFQEYHIIVDTNLPSHFYRFTRPELSVSGSEDTHITVTFIVEVSSVWCACRVRTPPCHCSCSLAGYQVQRGAQSWVTCRSCHCHYCHLCSSQLQQGIKHSPMMKCVSTLYMIVHMPVL